MGYLWETAWIRWQRGGP